MAKTKEEEEAGGQHQPKTRINNNNKNIKDKNNDRNKKNLENGLYVHSSPPKALNSNSGHGSATIRDYIRAADIASLEEVVLQGQGTKLVNQPATDTRVRNFLKTVPSYMSKIDLIHDSVEKGNLRELKALLDRRKLARSKDSHGVGLLHKAVVHDHRAIVDYLISDYPETLEVTDNTLTMMRNTHTLETLQEMPEDSSPEPTESTPAPPSTPTTSKEGSCSPSTLESVNEDEDQPTMDVAEYKSSKGGVDTRYANAVDGVLEMVRLHLQEGLELEVADWSENDVASCYVNDIQKEVPPEKRDIFTPELSRSINNLLSRGRSGQLPRMKSKPEAVDLVVLGKAIPRLTDHGECMNGNIVYPTNKSRSSFAYQNHVRRMTTVRRRSMENVMEKMALQRPLSTRPRLPNITQRSALKKREPLTPRPLTPTPRKPISSAKRRWNKLKPLMTTTELPKQLVLERLSNMFNNMSDSDPETEQSGKKSPGNVNSAQSQSSFTESTLERNSSLSSVPSTTSGTCTPFNITIPVVTPSQKSVDVDSGIEEDNKKRESKAGAESTLTTDSSANEKEMKDISKSAQRPSISQRRSRVEGLSKIPSPDYKNDNPEDTHLERKPSNPNILQRETHNPNAVIMKKLDSDKPPSITIKTKNIERKKNSLLKSKDKSSTNLKSRVKKALALKAKDILESFDKENSTAENASKGSPVEDTTKKEAVDLEVNEDLILASYSRASPAIKQYIRWLTARIIGEGFIDLKSVYANAIHKHEEKKDIWNVVYDHDISYWARVIVEQVMEKVIESLSKFRVEGSLFTPETFLQYSGLTEINHQPTNKDVDTVDSRATNNEEEDKVENTENDVDVKTRKTSTFKEKVLSAQAVSLKRK